MPIRKLSSLYSKRSYRSVYIYVFTNFLAKATAFLLLAIFTNPDYITPAGNGLLALFTNSTLLLLPFLSLGIVHSTSTEFFKLDKNGFSNLFTTGIILSLILMVFACVLLFFFRFSLHYSFGFPVTFVLLIPVMSFLIFTDNLMQTLARNRNDTSVFLKSNIARVFLEAGLSVILVVGLAWQWQGRISGLITAYIVTGLYAIYYFYKNDYLSGKFSRSISYNELLFAIPVITLQLSTFCMGSSDRFFLAYFKNNDAVGIYNVASAFGSVIIILCTAVLQYIFPRIYRELARKEDASYIFIRKTFLKYAAVMAAATLLIIILIPVAYRLVINEIYYQGINYAWLLCCGYFLWTITWFFFSFLLYFKEKKKILLLSTFFVIISLLLNYFFITNYSEWGAAIANVCTYSLVLTLTILFTRKYWSVF